LILEICILGAAGNLHLSSNYCQFPLWCTLPAFLLLYSSCIHHIVTSGCCYVFTWYANIGESYFCLSGDMFVTLHAL
jgi:hypothetical protein